MKWIITGGCGFIGFHAAKRFLERGDEVVVIDDLSRKGSRNNLKELRERLCFNTFNFCPISIIDKKKVDLVFKEHKDVDCVLHLAAQTAVTTSIINPILDFNTNVIGTLNILESIKKHSPKSVIVNASTNKVYGDLSENKIQETSLRYLSKDTNEFHPLKFTTPYGCSKGSAEQYVLDYNKTYGIKTISLRQSCVYGPQQFGVEDQGWVSWFIIAAMIKKELTIYGTGKQVRDILFVDDLIDCYEKCYENIEEAQGEVFNIGGGLTNALSLLELSFRLELSPSFEIWRHGDQKVYISDIQKAKDLLKWEPKTQVDTGLDKTIQWIAENVELIQSIIK